MAEIPPRPTCFFSMTLDMWACSAGFIAEKSMSSDRGSERATEDVEEEQRTRGKDRRWPDNARSSHVPNGRLPCLELTPSFAVPEDAGLPLFPLPSAPVRRLSSFHRTRVPQIRLTIPSQATPASTGFSSRTFVPPPAHQPTHGIAFAPLLI